METLGLNSKEVQNKILSNLITNLSSMAGIQSSVMSQCMLKLKYRTKTKILAINPKTFVQLKFCIEKSFPDLSEDNLLDNLQIYFRDSQNEKCEIQSDEDLLAAYRLMQVTHSSKPLVVTIGNDTEIADEAPIFTASDRNLERQIIIREKMAFEFYRKTKRSYIFRCHDWREGCEGTWILFDRDTKGMGKPADEHTIQPQQHTWRFNNKVDRKTQLLILGMVDMTGTPPCILPEAEIDSLISKMIDINPDYKLQDLLSLLANFEGEFNIPCQSTLESKFSVALQKSSLKSSIMPSSILTKSNHKFCRHALSYTENDIQKICLIFTSDFQKNLALNSSTLYITPIWHEALDPLFTTLVTISVLDNKVLYPVTFILTQSSTNFTYSKALAQAHTSSLLRPTEIVVAPCPDLTKAVVKVFGSEVRYKTCSYYIQDRINSFLPVKLARCSSKTRNLLYLLKMLSFRCPKIIVKSLRVLEVVYASNEQKVVLEKFNELFMKTLSFEYWVYKKLPSDTPERKKRYIQINRLLEHHTCIIQSLATSNTLSSLIEWMQTTEDHFRNVHQTGAKLAPAECPESKTLQALLQQRFSFEEILEDNFHLDLNEPQDERAKDKEIVRWDGSLSESSQSSVFTDTLKFCSQSVDTKEMKSYFKCLYPRKGDKMPKKTKCGLLVNSGEEKGYFSQKWV